MMEPNTPASSVQIAYDRIAGEYDRQVAGDRWMRERLWKRYAALFQPGDEVLDVCCGTGIDAVFLAQIGMQVTAIDISPEMIAHCRARARLARLEHLIDAQVLDLANIGHLPPASFDDILSDFAGLNTVPDLARFARDASRLLRPNGHLIVHMLNRRSFWEWLSLVLHRHWAEARALGQNPYRTFEIGGVPVLHTLYFPRDAFQQYFAANFRLDRAYALGVLRPPHDVRWVPVLVANLLGALETLVGSHRPWLNRGRFFVLELVKRPADDGSG